MSVITIIVLNVVTYLGKPELEEELLRLSTVILDAVLEIVNLVGSAAVAINYVASEAKIDAEKAKNGSAPK